MSFIKSHPGVAWPGVVVDKLGQDISTPKGILFFVERPKVFEPPNNGRLDFLIVRIAITNGEPSLFFGENGVCAFTLSPLASYEFSGRQSWSRTGRKHFEQSHG